jgi:hypothetical protein
VDIAWADVLRGALSFFLVVAGVGIGYVCLRLGGMFGRLSVSVREVTDEVVPILSRAQTTVDGINLELSRVDEIMVTAVNATKGAEKTVTSISNAVAAPAKKASGFAAAAKEALATFRARRAAGPDNAAETPPTPPPEPPTAAAEPEPVETAHNGRGSEPPSDLPPELRNRGRGPSMSQISWALPKRHA